MFFCYLNRFKIFALIVSLVALSACSVGRPGKYRLIPGENNESIKIAQKLPSTKATCLTTIPISSLPHDAVNRKNTLFIHPGLLLFGLNWDRSLAVEAGSILAEQRFAGKVREIGNRDTTTIYDHAINDPGTDFIGLHYSMGGRPDIIRGSLDAIKNAAKFRGIPLRYHAILFDPFLIADVGALIDINEPELGYIFILLSSEYSFLRPRVVDISKSFLNSGKLIFVLSEDYDENWGHFGMLSAFREQHFNDPEHSGGKKMRALFQGMLAMALNGNGSFPVQPAQPCSALPEPAPLTRTGE